MNKKDAVQELSCGYRCEVVSNANAPKLKPIPYKSVCTHAEVHDVNTGKIIRVKLGGKKCKSKK